LATLAASEDLSRRRSRTASEDLSLNLLNSLPLLWKRKV
jgi:hypothetical protein